MTAAAASANRCAEDIVVLSIVISKAKLRDVEWEISRVGFVEGADRAALNQRPETLNRIRVDGLL